MPPATRWSAQAAGRLLRGMVPFLARGSSLRGASALEAAAGGDAVAREGGRLVGEGEGRDGSQGPSESQARASGQGIARQKQKAVKAVKNEASPTALCCETPESKVFYIFFA